MEWLQDWRSPQFEEDLARLDRGGVGFEFLRRNKNYQQDYATTLTEIATGGTTRAEAFARLSRRWGLAFPGGPRRTGLDRSPDLATSRVPGGPHYHGHSRRLCRVHAS